MKFQLVLPAERYHESFLRALREFRQEGLPWWLGGDLVRVIERNGGSLRETRALGANRPLKRYYWIDLP